MMQKGDYGVISATSPIAHRPSAVYIRREMLTGVSTSRGNRLNVVLSYNRFSFRPRIFPPSGCGRTVRSPGGRATQWEAARPLCAETGHFGDRDRGDLRPDRQAQSSIASTRRPGLLTVLGRIAGYPASRLHELLPWNWKKPIIQGIAG